MNDKRDVRESPVKRAIRTYLATLAPEGFFWAAPVSLFGDSGWPDRLGVFRGWAIAIEIKRPSLTHPVTKNQIAFLRAFHAAGGVHIIATSVVDVKAVLEQLEWKRL